MSLKSVQFEIVELRLSDYLTGSMGVSFAYTETSLIPPYYNIYSGPLKKMSDPYQFDPVQSEVNLYDSVSCNLKSKGGKRRFVHADIHLCLDFIHICILIFDETQTSYDAKP